MSTLIITMINMMPLKMMMMMMQMQVTLGENYFHWFSQGLQGLLVSQGSLVLQFCSHAIIIGDQTGFFFNEAEITGEKKQRVKKQEKQFSAISSASCAHF